MQYLHNAHVKEVPVTMAWHPVVLWMEQMDNRYADILNEPPWKEVQSDQANLGLGVGLILHPNKLHFIVALELVVWILRRHAGR
jgi:hypothetical protein